MTNGIVSFYKNASYSQCAILHHCCIFICSYVEAKNRKKCEFVRVELNMKGQLLGICIIL